MGTVDQVHCTEQPKKVVGQSCIRRLEGTGFGRAEIHTEIRRRKRLVTVVRIGLGKKV